MALIGLAAAPLWGGRDDLQLLSQIYAYVALASLWNLLAGYAGLVSVGQQAYVGLGAYMLFGLAILGGISPLWAIPLAGLISGVIALPVAALVFRLRGHYFAIGTWIVAEVFRLLASQVSLLGGGSGTSLPAAVVIAMAPSRQARDFLLYWIALALVVAVLALDRLVAALALRAGAEGDPRQRACGALQRHRRHPHQAIGLCRHRLRHRDGRRADLSAEAPHLARRSVSASTTGPPLSSSSR